MAPDDGLVRISTEGSEVDTILKLVMGPSVGNGAYLGMNDDEAGNAPFSAWRLRVSRGSTYHFFVSMRDPRIGQVHIRVSYRDHQPSPPPNDSYANRTLIPASVAQVTADIRGATLEPGERPLDNYPDGVLVRGGEIFKSLNTAGHTVWWRWISPGPGIVTFTTEGSTFDTILRVAGTVTNINDDALPAVRTSRVSMPAIRADQEFSICVDGVDNSVGTALLNVSFVPAAGGLTKPANDDLAQATALTGELVHDEGSLFGSTAEIDEFSAGAKTGSVWWQWTAPHDAEAFVSVALGDLSVSIWTRDEGGQLHREPLLHRDGLTGFARFNANSGKTYYLQVFAPRYLPENISLTIDARLSPLPAPTLEILHQPSGRFAIAKHGYGVTAHLQASSDLINWQIVIPEPSLSDTPSTVTPSAESALFYRLYQAP